MEPIERMNTFSYYAILAITIFATLFPVISFFGHLFTSDGRKSMKENPTVIIYFLFFFPIAYLYWFDLALLKQYLHIDKIYIDFLYIGACFATFLKTDAVE